MTLGERIKKYRHVEGLSQDELAEKLNVSRQAITKWENDNGVPDIDNLIALSRLMGLTLDELVMGEREESVSIITQEVTYQRKRNSNTCLFSAILFSFVAFCHIMACISNVGKGNFDAAMINGFTIIISAIPIIINLKRYFILKEQ